MFEYSGAQLIVVREKFRSISLRSLQLVRHWCLPPHAEILWNFSLVNFVLFSILNTYHRHFVGEKLFAQTINHKIEMIFIEFSNKFKAENWKLFQHRKDEGRRRIRFFFCYFSVATWCVRVCVWRLTMSIMNGGKCENRRKNFEKRICEE